MADWLENKGAGPWPFTEQLDKWGYLNNPRWSAQQDAQEFCEKVGLSLNPSDQHLPCGHWHKGPAVSESGEEFYDACSLEPFFDWSESVPSESFIGYSGEKIFILQRIYANGKVYVYDVDGSSITNFSTITGTSPACMQCLAVDNSYCFVGAASNIVGPITYAHIAKFDHNGIYLTHWKIGTGTFGSSVNGVYSDGDYVYITSLYGLHKYNRSGVLSWEFPYHGLGIGEFWTAHNLWSDKTHIFVADYSYSKILKYSCSDGSFIIEETIMVPANPTGITVDDKYVYVSRDWGICVFYKDTLEFICCADFDDYAYDPSVLGSIAYDGKYWWGLDDLNDKVVKFDVHVTGEPIVEDGDGDKASIISDEPQVWPMPE